MKFGFYYQMEWLQIGVQAEEKHITGIVFGRFREPCVLRETAEIQEAGRQIRDYCSGRRREFELPVSLRATEFQKAVWTALLDIPYGETRSYAQIARAIGCPKACRAVGGANHRNPLPILYPCHRVVGADGSLTGYAGGMEIKQYLLELEQNNK